MKRRDFVNKSIIATAGVAGAGLQATAGTAQKNNEVYEFRVYHMHRNLKPLDDYFTKAFIPALNRMGVRNVGVFTELSKDEPPVVYALIPYKSLEEYARISLALRNDKQFAEAKKEYDAIPAQQPVYERYDSSLMIAFDGFPQMAIPVQRPRLFELRIYEGYSEDAVKRKVKMFNSGEIDIFKKVKINGVFFGENISGKGLPCLTYLSVYDDMTTRDAAWDAFRAHPDWQKMSGLPEYANTVSRIHRVFLEPTAYSQV